MAPSVLILCTGNSARSQMAEGLLRVRTGDRLVVESAGNKPSAVHPLAIRAMDEIGIDIRSQHSKHLDVFLDRPFDFVITVCDNAAKICPVFPGRARRIHWSLPDPAGAPGSEKEQLDAFRRVRTDLDDRILAWLDELGQV